VAGRMLRARELGASRAFVTGDQEREIDLVGTLLRYAGLASVLGVIGAVSVETLLTETPVALPDQGT
jgi:hypothetical protein